MEKEVVRFHYLMIVPFKTFILFFQHKLLSTFGPFVYSESIKRGPSQVFFLNFFFAQTKIVWDGVFINVSGQREVRCCIQWTARGEVLYSMSSDTMNTA